MNGWYYLHVNGDLIHKSFCPDDDSDLVRKVWPVDATKRENAWTIILEALALGANLSRIRELAGKWRCDTKDFVELIRRAKPSPLMIEGAASFLRDIADVEPGQFWAWLKSTPKGEEPNFATMPGRL